MHRKDIVMLVNSFYDMLKVDTTIVQFFSTVAMVNWEHPLPVKVDFWESVLLDGRSYSGNPTMKHIVLNKQYRLSKEHFAVWSNYSIKQWMDFFTESKAAEAKVRAEQIALLK